MIAMALSCDPQVLIADEPTTALDVTIQAQILDLMLELKEKTGTAIVLITHDLGVVAETAQRVVVMYAGRKVEEAPVEALFDRAAASLYARPDAGDPARSMSRPTPQARGPGCRRSPAWCRLSRGRSSAAPSRRAATFATDRCRSERAAADRCRHAATPSPAGKSSACGRARHEHGACPRGREAGEAFPDPRRAAAAPRRRGEGGRRRQLRHRARARRWAWWANRAAASRPSARPC